MIITASQHTGLERSREQRRENAFSVFPKALRLSILSRARAARLVGRPIGGGRGPECEVLPHNAQHAEQEDSEHRADDHEARHQHVLRLERQQTGPPAAVLAVAGGSCVGVAPTRSRQFWSNRRKIQV